MQKRKEMNRKYVQWILNKVNREYADDIRLVLLYGSYTNGTAGPKSDVDCYFIPKTERGYNLAVTFILDGVGYDLYPIPWERVERIANLQEGMPTLLADVQILYANSPEDAQHFAALQETLKQNLHNVDLVRSIAADRCAEAGKLCARLNQTLNLSEIRKTAGCVIMTLAEAVAIANHEYYHKGLKKQFEDLRTRFPNVPEGIAASYQNVVEADTAEDIIRSAKKMFGDVCSIDCAPQESPEEAEPAAVNQDLSWLAGLYEEISATFQKIYVCCESGNHILAFLSAVCLQLELDFAAKAGCPAYDLLSGFHYTALDAFAENVQETEAALVQLIAQSGGHIKKFSSFAEFESADV